jgi:hypothetical protein
MPIDTNLFQRVGDWFEQRKAYRQAALAALRKREGLSSPVDADGNDLETRFDDYGNAHYYNAAGEKVERVMFAGVGRDGKPGSFAIGKRKQPSETVIDEKGIPRTVPTADMSAAWGRSSKFEILEVAEDGRKRKLADELRDLDRDATAMEMAERISHGEVGEQAPDLVLDGTSDEEIDQKLQEFLKKGSR